MIYLYTSHQLREIIDYEMCPNSENNVLIHKMDLSICEVNKITISSISLIGIQKN